MGDAAKIFAQNLALRLAGHGSKADIARKSGIARSVIDKWLEGSTSPTLETMTRLTTAMGIEPWELLMPTGGIEKHLPEPLGADHPPEPTLSNVMARLEAIEQRLPPASSDLGKLVARLSSLDEGKVRTISEVIDDYLRASDDINAVQVGDRKKSTR